MYSYIYFIFSRTFSSQLYVFSGWCEAFRADGDSLFFTESVFKFSEHDVSTEKALVQTTYTHRVSSPTVFLQNQDKDPVLDTYFDQRIPVPDEKSEVIQGLMDL